MIAIKIDDKALSSRFFGEAYLPESWLGSDEFSLTEIFFCQIDLEKIAPLNKSGLLPDKGYLYFFIDFDVTPVKGTVRYAPDPDALTFFNEGAESDYDVETARGITFYEAETADNGLFEAHKKLYDNEVCLLKFTPNTLPDIDFLSDTDGAIMFVIDKTDLLNRRFDKAFLINVK